MSAATTTTPRAATERATVTQLAALEVRRYAKHPLFVLGVLVTTLVCIGGPDEASASYMHGIVPATAFGVLGLVIMAGQARSSSTLSRSAGAPPVTERTQTTALALTALLPFAAGLLWFAWAVWARSAYPVPANGFPFGPVADDAGWQLAVLFGAGPMACLGGPLIGLVIGRWLPQRGVAPLAVVLLVAAVIVMQGLFEPLRQIRVVMPWTHWGGPNGIDSDDMRMFLFSGSPQWWVAYLLTLCGLGVVAARAHDPAARTARLKLAGACLLTLAVATCLLAMFTGVDQTLINPLQSSTGAPR